MNTRKFSTCLNEHWTVKGHHHLKAKIGYKTEEEAKQFMIDNKINPKYKVYKCSHCGEWHIGHMHFPKKKENK